MHHDEQLIDVILAGDQAAFAELVNRHKRMAFNVAFRILKEENEAEESAQDAFVKVYRNLHRFNRESKFTTWFYRIVTNEALGRARKKKHAYVDISEAHSLGCLDRNASENALRIREGIAALPDKDQLVLTLFYLDELSLDEIGEMLEMATNTAKVNLHRARKKLATTMLAQIGDEVYELLED